MIFGRWTPVGAFGAALLFGGARTLGQAVQIDAPPGQIGEWIASWPAQIFGMFPYILTIIVLAGVVGKAIPPAADGIPYDKGGRQQAAERSARGEDRPRATRPGADGQPPAPCRTSRQELHRHQRRRPSSSTADVGTYAPGPVAATRSRPAP
jgi:hypothetical protein